MLRSKTDLPCDCRYLDNAAEDADKPIEFDAKLNEFHIVCASGGQLMIYHCPFCGGTAPKSRRDSLFSKPSHQEQMRLVRLTNALKTLDAVLLTLGNPDRDNEVGVVIGTPEKDGVPSQMQAYRTLIYQNLSETADVHVLVYPTERVAISFQGKYIGDKG